MICPTCEGTGFTYQRVLENPAQDVWTHLPCPMCQGSGIAYCCDKDCPLDDEILTEVKDSTVKRD